MKKTLPLVSFVLIISMIFSSCKKEDSNAPTACFEVPNEILAGTPTSFNSSCSENAISFSWDFGDGTTSTETHPGHTYAAGGSYTVSLMVIGVDGGSDETAATVTVMAPEIIEHSGTISSDETWFEGVHMVIGDVHVDGATLTIEPGSVVKFVEGTALYLGYHSGSSGATLIANGTMEKPITFTSAAANKSAGDWDYIWFDGGASTQSTMMYCIIEYSGGYSDNYGSIHIAETAVSIQNTVVKLSASHGITLDDEAYFESFTHNTVEENANSAIKIYGNYVHTIGADNILVSQKGIAVQGDQLVMSDVTWLKQTTGYVIQGDIRVGSQTGSTLTLDPGVEIMMGSGSAIYFGYSNGTFGTLLAEGTAGDHITITSSAPEGSKSAGDWDYLWFDDGAGTSSVVAYCDIEYGGGYSANYGMIHIDGAGISLSNSTIMKSESQGVSLTNDAMFVECFDNVFGENSTFPIELYANYAHTIGLGNTFNTGPGLLVNADYIEQADITWHKQDIPYILDGNIRLGSASGSKLTIEPGTVVKFTEGTSLYVGYTSGTFGILIADGDAANQIVFSSAAPSGFESAGDWDGIWFYDGTSGGTILDHCTISFGGGYSSNSGNLIIKNEAAGVPVISNCQIQSSGSWGIYLDNGAQPTLTDNIFGSNALGDTNL